MENKVLIMDNDAHTKRELCKWLRKKGYPPILPRIRRISLYFFKGSLIK